VRLLGTSDVIAGRVNSVRGASAAVEEVTLAAIPPKSRGKNARIRLIQDGDVKAPRIVYLFSDPNCPYCNMFWEQARPWVKAGKVQLRHIMVGIIREDSPGKSAALFAAKDPQKALEEHEAAGKGSKLQALAKIPADIEAKLDAVLKLLKPKKVTPKKAAPRKKPAAKK